MEQVTMTAEPRPTGKGPARRARAAGYIPAVLYGRGREAQPLRLPERELVRLLSSPHGKNTLIRLEVPDQKGEPPTVMIKDLQLDPVRRRLLHVDLLAVSLREKVHTRVPIRVEGEEVVAKAGGIVQHQLREVEVECLPTAIPDEITAPIAHLGVGDHLNVGDLRPPEGVTILDDPDEVVLAIVAPRAAEVEKPEAEVPAKGEAPAAEAPEAGNAE